MKDKKKILGLIGLTVSTVVSTIVTQWMADREIKKQVNEAIAERDQKEEP